MLDEQSREDLIERITAIFTNEADAAAFNEDPDGYVDEHLPEGTEGADVASCLPDVGERTGLDFTNVASSGAAPAATAAGQLSYTYETIYQQNSFIYAEEGSQVTNIQGDGNAVAQQDVDVDIDVEYGEGETEEPAPEPEPDPPADPPVILREAPDLVEDGYDGSGINPDLGVEEAPDPVGAIDLEFSNTADAGAEAPPEEAPEPEPVDDIPDV
jgi:hypothetical protein